MSKHTPGPWFVADRPWDDRGTAIYGNRTLKIGPPNDPHGAELVSDCNVTMEWEDGNPDPLERDRANAARIVACVNALDGIEDPVAARAILDEPCTEHAAEMLAALKAVREFLIAMKIDSFKLDDVIAKAEGRK